MKPLSILSTLCRNLNGKKMEFQIWHVKGGDRWLGADEC